MPENSQIVKTVQAVMPAVVSIAVSKKLERVEKDLAQAFPYPYGHMDMHVPPDKIDAHGMVQVGGGSGCITTKDGTILTNKHVISEPYAEYTVILSDGKKYPAKVVARDPMDDIAILKIKEKVSNLPTIKLGGSKNIQLGSTVLAFGNALGTFKNTVSSGIVSGLARTIEAMQIPGAPTQEMRGLIQTDAAINPGNSGGPLTDAEGNMIGINTAIVVGAQNIGFAIPVHTAIRDLNDLKKHGKIKRPLLGIRYLTITPEIKAKIGLPVDDGALVTKQHPLDKAIAKGGPADKAGIQESDIILKWNGGKITEEVTIQDYLGKSKVGDKVELTVFRNKRETTKKVLLTERK